MSDSLLVRARGRPRDETLRLKMLDAAILVAARHGYSATTIKAICDAAGIDRKTFYRWWQSKQEILLEAVTNVATAEATDTQTLPAFLDSTFANAQTEIGKIVVGLMADAQSDAQFHKRLSAQLIANRRKVLRDILRAHARTKNSAYKISVDTLVDTVFGAMWYRMLDRHGVIGRQLRDELVQMVEDMLDG